MDIKMYEYPGDKYDFWHRNKDENMDIIKLIYNNIAEQYIDLEYLKELLYHKDVIWNNETKCYVKHIFEIYQRYKNCPSTYVCEGKDEYGIHSRFYIDGGYTKDQLKQMIQFIPENDTN